MLKVSTIRTPVMLADFYLYKFPAKLLIEFDYSFATT